ncbi:type VI secretion system baseplate subunit TssG [Phocaeicola dorei]|nr:type VI secretion system baseplate subunit TssG [Phocaeicola dorei]
MDSCLIPKLGSCILGDDMVLGNSFADGTYQMLVEIGPLSARRMESFFSGAADSKILNALTELFLPSDKEIQIRYIIQQEDAQFRLGTPTEQGAYLGISTYL